MSEAPATRIVVIGYGPVGARLVEELLPGVRDGLLTVTVVGAEREDAYNRVLLAEYAVGRADRERLELSDRLEAEGAGVVFRLGETVTRINRIRQDVTLSSDATVPYDRLVLATGARANIPTLDGLLPYSGDGARDPGCRSCALAAWHRGAQGPARRRASPATRSPRMPGSSCSAPGCSAWSSRSPRASRAPRWSWSTTATLPMERNLDHGGGRMLARAAERAGVRMLKHSRAESVLLHTRDDGRQVFSGLVCADGKQVGGDLLVLSCGVTARAELASQAGLATARGILVDEELRSWTDPDIFAIGDCAHVAPRGEADAPVPGGPSGLVGPGWRQADWLAQVLLAEAAGARRPALLEAESIRGRHAQVRGRQRRGRRA